MVLTVHHLRVSQSERIVWLCEELGIQYELKIYDREPSAMAPEEYKRISPLKTAPVIEDENTYTPNPEHVVLAESQACIEWICRKYGQGRLVNRPWDANWSGWLFWWHFTNSSLQPALTTRMFAKDLPEDHMVRKFSQERVEHYLNVVEERLGQSKYLVGNEFTAADIMLVFPLTTNRIFAPLDLSPYPNILRYLKDIGERPAYIRAMQRGDSALRPLLEANPAPQPFTSK